MRKFYSPLANNVCLLIIMIINLVVLSTAYPIEGKSLSSRPSQVQNVKVFIPVLMSEPLVIEEENPPGCRWSRTPGGFIAISYKWGDRLQVPGTSWRTAFEAAAYDWTSLSTKVYFYYSSSSLNVFNTYSADDGNGGQAFGYCSGTVTSHYEMLGNVYYSQTTNQYRAYSNHEAGHGQSIDHIANPGLISIMGYNPDPDIFYRPQSADVVFVKQVYP